ncbi:UDP-N-acetylmuramoyl-L-alanyl-D-glutamate--2,6-diaminopimelate ligase [Oikeobacillus pervagus]|uniref:UDP-N-acetylmuramoyl-L-alanyl-D-glutamate--2,6-diaminopimelate ligase n=1 Tax=Oikeobacillus pervagus TaxID=1325931 RepID=A0AAJ1WJA0_9BACI|nr:UDP-N-acetylmuramoyl-L-alanyl-D-glutamate--2,6-diaminopimelate ligase [Oikeobacillus pervagus]MDQ0215238.1 UDP-N-acetylmuramoyl-L-alanyl-D-glutamate--2,6-diaminopimelate ligase [Oikeobacillus pervagus]
MDLLNLLKSLPFYELNQDKNPMITSIENDHRKVKKGSLFICIKGYTVDGHQFAKEAVNKGAVAILAEKSVEVDVPVILVPDTKRAMSIVANHFYASPTKDFRLIGITGTNGKTTTSHLIEEMFREANEKTGLIGTMYMKIGEEVLKTKNTTPESLTLQKVFHQMKEEDVSTAIMEVSSHSLIEGRVHGCDYNIAVFTNLTQDHLDYHHTMEEYRHAKSLLFSQLGNTYDVKNPKYAVLNADDQASQEFEKETAAHVVTYGIEKSAQFQARNIQLTAEGTSFELFYPNGMEKVQTNLVGQFNVYNALAAIAAAFVANIDMNTILTALKKIKGVTGRFQLVKGTQDFAVIVDYAHTPDSLENVLKTVRPLTDQRIFVVVGCGGDRDRTKRPLMAKVACEYATNPIFTSDNPRSEDPISILKDMEKGVPGKQYELIADRRDAITHAIKEANTGDVIVIAGKGHETYQILGDQVIDFDDQKVALEALKER